MKFFLKCFTFFLIIINSHQDYVQYHNFSVYRVQPQNKEHLNLLKQLELDVNLQFWTDTKNVYENVDIMLPPDKLHYFKTVMDNNGLKSEILISNVQEQIDNQRIRRNAELDFGWDEYHTLEEINSWLSKLANNYSEKVTLKKGGTSYEDRPIVGVHVSFSPENENKSIFIESNIHACEWISSAVSTYILNEILTSTDPAVREIAESYDWYFFPVINPDGFTYTHSTDRLWRKNRVPHGECIGADPNRNWDNHFGESGSSNDSCAMNYSGEHAFSEPETKSLSDYLLTIGNTLEGYISFHSYSQILLLPYGFTTEHLDNYDELREVGTKAIDVLSQRYGTKYQIGNVAEILYAASGGSFDWVKETFGTRITYTYELPDTGNYGFLLPPELIIPTAEETFDSFITIFQEFAKKPSVQ